MTTLLVTLGAVFLTLLLRAETRHNLRGRYLFKPLASLMFILVGVVSAPDFGFFTVAVLVGLVLGAGGDVALMFASKKAFLVGLVLFLLGHLGYAAAFWSALEHTGINWLFFALFAGICGLGLWLIQPKFGALFWPSMAYMVVILVMVALSWHYHLDQGLRASGPIMMAWGSTLFFFSDFLVAREAFGEKTIVNRLIGLPLYYAGQFMIAAGLAYLPSS